MGYRSAVYIKANKPAYTRIMKAITEQDEPVRPIPSKIFKDIDDGMFYIIFDWIKWYSDQFSEIKAIENVMEDINREYVAGADAKDCGWYKFIRLGEDIEDNEEKSSDDDLAGDFFITRDVGMPDEKDLTELSFKRELKGNNADNYLLITVVDQEISTEKFKYLEDAQVRMREELIDANVSSEMSLESQKDIPALYCADEYEAYLSRYSSVDGKTRNWRIVPL